MVIIILSRQSTAWSTGSTLQGKTIIMIMPGGVDYHVDDHDHDDDYDDDDVKNHDNYDNGVEDQP